MYPQSKHKYQENLNANHTTDKTVQSKFNIILQLNSDAEENVMSGKGKACVHEKIKMKT